MTKERLFRRNDEVGALDWQRVASELGVDLDAARLLHEYALNVALGDPPRAASVYLSSLYSYAEAQHAEPPPVPGRLTRAAYEASPGKHWTPNELVQVPIGNCSSDARREIAGIVRDVLGSCVSCSTSQQSIWLASEFQIAR